jgi:regulator of sigma D
MENELDILNDSLEETQFKCTTKLLLSGTGLMHGAIGSNTEQFMNFNQYTETDCDVHSSQGDEEVIPP